MTISKKSLKELEKLSDPDAAAIQDMMGIVRGFDAERLMDLLGDLFNETLLVEGVSSAEMVIDNIVWCPMDNQYEATELAKTVFPFIIKAIVEGGRATNHYVITVNPVR